MLTTAGWIRARFGPVNIEQVVLNLPAGEGEGRGVGSLVTEAVLVCLVGPVILVGAFAALAGRRGRHRPARPTRRPLAFAVVAFLAGVAVLLWAAGVPQWASALWSGRTFAPYYVRPTAPGTPSAPRNLITIYLESGENSYADADVFGRNLLVDLDRATAGWTWYDGLHQYPGGGWTMAGLVATDCAIPLRSRLLADPTNLDDYGEGVARYLPGATCLGDLLRERGYDNVMLGGASAHFAGKETFFRDHGYGTVLGLSDWEAAGDTELSGWGLSDHVLFEHATTVVDRLAAAGRPFNLTMLTLDTHDPPGVFPSCATDDDAAAKVAVTCSMRAVAGFLDHLRQSGILKNSVVVITGDHLKMTGLGTSFGPELAAITDRTIVCRIWSPDPITVGRATADQLSLLPSTLDLLGVGPGDGRAGLGVSFVGHHPVAGTALELPAAEYSSTVTSPTTDLYHTFWGG